MVASTPYEQEILWNQYVYSGSEKPDSTFDRRQFPDIILRLLACGIGSSESEIIEAIGNLYAPRLSHDKAATGKMIESSLSYLIKGGLPVPTGWGR